MKLLFILLPVLAWAANIKLSLTDGTHQMVREYKLADDRVRYYSLERAEWEEVPKELVDLKRTLAELTERDASRSAERKAIAEEDQAEREQYARIARIPEGVGVYWASGAEMKPLVLAESKLVTDKKRTLLKLVSPVPFFAGKATVEIDGEKSEQVFKVRRPDFFMRLSADENFAIIKLLPGKPVDPKSKDAAKAKGSRIVEKVLIDPVAKDMRYEEPLIVEIFRQQLGDRLFKIWPTEDLAPGQYAVIQFTAGKVNAQVWDFAIE